MADLATQSTKVDRYGAAHSRCLKAPEASLSRDIIFEGAREPNIITPTMCYANSQTYGGFRCLGRVQWQPPYWALTPNMSCAPGKD